MTLAPRIEGTVAIRSPNQEFVDAFRKRVAAGLLSGHAGPRSSYRVVDGGRDRLRVRAEGWWTAINVGLNDIELRITRPGFVDYQVCYWRWAAYALGLSGVLGLIGVGLLLGLDARGYFAREPGARYPGLSVDGALALAWGMVVFWGFAWPWILINLHKGPLRGLMARIIAEVDGPHR
jgi:hypothetical protein